MVDCGEEILVVETDERDGEVLTRNRDFGAASQMLPAGIHSQIEQLRFGVGDKSQRGGIGYDDGAQR